MSMPDGGVDEEGDEEEGAGVRTTAAGDGGSVEESGGVDGFGGGE